MIDEGIKSAARASASSGVCLNLTVSRLPVAAGAALPALVPVVAAVGFFAAGAAGGGGAVVVGFFG